MGANLAATLPALLRQRDLTQAQLAEKTGMNRTDINRIANGKILVGPSRLRRIADALDVSVLELAPEAEADSKALDLDGRLAALEEQALTTEDLQGLLRVVQLLAAGKRAEAQRALSEAGLGP